MRALVFPDMPVDIVLIRAARVLLEVAGYCIIAQGILFVLTGKSRERNFVYRLFQVLTRPAYKITRAITPKVILDQHIPWLAFFLIFWLWILLQFMKRYLCAWHQVDCPL